MGYENCGEAGLIYCHIINCNSIFMYIYIYFFFVKKNAAKMKALEREIRILKMVNHPHIIYLDKVFECPKKIYMIFELCTGELTKVMAELKTVQESDAKRMIKDILSAVNYLHKNGRYVSLSVYVYHC